MEGLNRLAYDMDVVFTADRGGKHVKVRLMKAFYAHSSTAINAVEMTLVFHDDINGPWSFTDTVEVSRDAKRRELGKQLHDVAVRGVQRMVGRVISSSINQAPAKQPYRNTKRKPRYTCRD